MALTITSPTGLNNVGAMGAPVSVTFTVTSDTANLVGSNIFIRLGMFLNSNEPVSNSTALPQDAYLLVYNINTTAPLFPTTIMHPSLRVFRVQATNMQPQSFDITIDFLHKADRVGYDTGSIEKLVHFEKNSINNTAFFDNSAPSAYNEIKMFRAEVSQYEDVTDNLLGRAVYDENFAARWWCEELFDCAELFPPGCIASSIASWGFTLTRNSLPVTDISISEDTVLNVSVDIPTGTIDEFYIAAYRRNSTGVDSEYWVDLDLAYAHYTPALNTLANSPFPLGPFQTFPLSFTNTMGTMWQVSIPLASSYFTVSGEYRFFCVIKHSNGAFYSCYSNTYLADILTPPVPFDVTGNIYDYSSDNDVYGECITGAACGERLKFCTMADEASYNAAAALAEINGTFQSNLVGIGNVVLDDRPTTADIIGTSQTYPFTSNTDNTGGCIELRIEDDWVGTTKYIVFSYVFLIDMGTFQYNEYSYHVMKVTTNASSTDLTATFTQSGDPLGNVICQSNTDPIIMTVTNAQGAEYEFISLIRPTGSSNWLEEAFYTNSNLDRQFNSFVSSVDPDFTGGDATLQVNADKLSLDTEYCIKAIAKSNPAVTPPPPTCIPIDVQFDLEITSVVNNPLTDLSTITFSISWNMLSVGTIDNITITAPHPNQGQTYTFSGTGNTGTLTGFIDVVDNAVPFIVYLTSYIELVSGCAYSTENVADNGTLAIGPVTKLAGQTGTTTITFNI